MDIEALSVKILKAMGHPIRLKIVKFLLDKPHCVCELKENLEFSQPNLSQHLKILKEAGIIESEKVGVQTLPCRFKKRRCTHCCGRSHGPGISEPV